MGLEKVCLILFFLWMGYFLWAKKMHAGKTNIFFGEKGEKKNKWENMLFSDGVKLLLVFCRSRFSIRMKSHTLKQHKKLFAGKSEEEIFYQYYGKIGCILAITVAAGLFLTAVSGFIAQKSILVNHYFLEKEGVLGQEKQVSLEASADGAKKEVTIQVPQQKYSKEQLKKVFAEAADYIDRTYLGENVSDEAIEKPLNLMDAVPNSVIAIEWDVGNDGLILSDGSLLNQDIKEKQQTKITAIMSYGEEEETLVKQLTILPEKRTSEEVFWEDWQKQLEQKKTENALKRYLPLPEEVEGKRISYREKKVKPAYTLFGIFVLLLVLIPIAAKENVQRKIARREEELRISYPGFVEHFVLLIGAGLSTKGAWERMVSDYRKERSEKDKSYVYEEMALSLREMKNGMSEDRAYELFGKRTGQLEYMKFCTLIVQNLKKGSDDLMKVLDYEIADAFRKRKENAKALGEKAGTKLLLPMMIMLVIIFVLILYAAFQGM